MKILKILYLLLFFTLNRSYAQDLCLAMADHFLENENYNEAITEYMRYIYFSQRTGSANPDHNNLDESFFKMGICYRNLSEWSKAIRAINQSLIHTTNDSIRDNRRLAIAIIRIATKKYSAAEIELLRLIHFSKTVSIKHKARFFLGICYLYQFKWQETQQQFNKYFSTQSNFSYLKLDSLLYQAKIIHYKSPKLAKWLSTFIPGSGQLYTGDIKNGINSIVINLLTGYLLIDAMIDKRFQDLFLSHITLFMRFYQGNRVNAERIVQSYNNKLNKETAQKIINYLEMNCE